MKSYVGEKIKNMIENKWKIIYIQSELIIKRRKAYSHMKHTNNTHNFFLKLYKLEQYIKSPASIIKKNHIDFFV